LLNFSGGESGSQNVTLDNSHPKCGGESISSNDKEIEYLRVIYAFKGKTPMDAAQHNVSNNSHHSSTFELTVELDEVVKLVEEDTECLDYDKSWIKVFNSQGLTGMIPSSCVEPIILENLQTINEFVFLRRPALVGTLAYNDWYFGNISRFDTILLLNKYASNGDFLVRDSDVRVCALDSFYNSLLNIFKSALNFRFFRMVISQYRSSQRTPTTSTLRFTSKRTSSLSARDCSRLWKSC
jgi:hypothetical protein